MSVRTHAATKASPPATAIADRAVRRWPKNVASAAELALIGFCHTQMTGVPPRPDENPGLPPVTPQSEAGSAWYRAYIMALGRGLRVEDVEEILREAGEPAGSPDPDRRKFFRALRKQVADVQRCENEGEDPTVRDVRDALLQNFESRDAEWKLLFEQAQMRGDHSQSKAIVKLALEKTARAAARAKANDLGDWVRCQVSLCARILGGIDSQSVALKDSIRKCGCRLEALERYFSGARVTAGRLAYRYTPAPGGTGESLANFFEHYTRLMVWFEDNRDVLSGIAFSQGIPAEHVHTFFDVDARGDVENSVTSHDPAREIGPWVKKIVRNCACRWQRTIIPLGQPLHPLRGNQLAADAPVTGIVLAREEDMALLEATLPNLGEHDAGIVLQRWLEASLEEDDAEIVLQRWLDGIRVPFSVMAIQFLHRDVGQRAGDIPFDEEVLKEALKSKKAALRQAHGRALEKLRAIIRVSGMRNSEAGWRELAAAMSELSDSDRLAAESTPNNDEGRCSRANALVRVIAHVDFRRKMNHPDGEAELREAAKFFRDGPVELPFTPVCGRTSRRMRQSRTGVTKLVLDLHKCYRDFIKWRLFVARQTANEKARGCKESAEAMEKIEALLSLLSEPWREVIRKYWLYGTPPPVTCSELRLNRPNMTRELLREQQNLKFERTTEYRLSVVKRGLCIEDCPLDEIAARYRPFFYAIIFKNRSYAEALLTIAVQPTMDAEIGGSENDPQDEDDDKNSSSIRQVLLHWQSRLGDPPRRPR